MAAVQRLRTIVALLDRSATRVARRSGINVGDMAVLYILNRANGSAPLRATDLHRPLMNTSGAITKRLDRLQAAGLVARVPDPSDGRAARVTITAAGRAAVVASRGDPGAEPPLHFGDLLTEAEWGELNRMLDRLIGFAKALDASDA